jgi:hypothetical protein
MGTRQVVAIVRIRRVNGRDGQLDPLSGLGVLQHESISAEITKPRATREHYHLMPSLQQLSATDAADHAGANNEDSHRLSHLSRFPAHPLHHAALCSPALLTWVRWDRDSDG